MTLPSDAERAASEYFARNARVPQPWETAPEYAPDPLEPVSGAIPAGETLAEETERKRQQWQAVNAEATARDRAEEARLEAKYGKAGTVAVQYARGLLDYVVEKGAIVGAAIETTGAMYGEAEAALSGSTKPRRKNVVERFGRDLGEASTGTQFLSAVAAVPEMASEIAGSVESFAATYTPPDGAPFRRPESAALSAWEMSERIVKDQQKAWPALSTVSSALGTVTGAVGTGGLAGGGGVPSLGTMVSLGAIEGAAGGAQMAYDERAPLRNVLTSTVLGGALGAATVGAIEYVPKVVSATRLRKAAGDLSANRTLSAMGFKASNVRALAKNAEVAPEAIENIVETIHKYRFDDGTELFAPIALRGGKPADYGAALARADGETLKKMRGMIQDADDLIPTHPDLAPNVAKLASRLETEVLEKLEKSPSHAVRGLADKIRPHIDDVRKLGGEIRETVTRTVPVESAVPKWKDFTKGKMGPYMKSEGGHGAAMTRLSREYQALIKATKEGGTGATREVVEEVVKRGETASASELWELRKLVDDLAWAEKGVARQSQMKDTPLGRELNKLARIMEEEVDRSVTAAAKLKNSSAVYTNVKRDFGALRDAKKVAYHAATHDFGNNWFGLGSTLTGVATLGADLATGGGFSAIKAIGAATAHKLIKERGSGYAALLFRKLARGESKQGLGRFARLASQTTQTEARLARRLVTKTGPKVAAKSTVTIAEDAANKELTSSLTDPGDEIGVAMARGGLAGRAGNAAAAMAARDDTETDVPIDVAGGREAQQAMNALARAQRKINAAEEAAGANPAARQKARQAAQAEAAAELAREAGEFDPAAWRVKPPNPLQKIVYRPALLDQIGADIARDAQNAPAAQQVELDPERVQQLAEDADGTAGIGNLQQAVDQAIEQAPQTPEGEVLRRELQQIRGALEQVDTPQAIIGGHSTIQRLREIAPELTDPIARSYVERQAVALETVLSSESFGSFGALYGLARTPQTEAFRTMSDPETAREVLRIAGQRGLLITQVREQADAAERAAEAAAALSGTEAPPVREFYRALEDRFAAAEDAVLVDGGPASRVTKLFRDRPGARIARELGDRPENVVANAVRPRVEQLIPVLYGEPEKGGKRLELPPPPSREDRYTQHMDRVAQLEEARDRLGEDFLADGLSGFDDEVQAEVAIDVAQQLEALYEEMPKPETDWRGRVSGLSDGDLRHGEAVWSATVDPLSILDDFRHGSVDPDKVAYVHRNSPGAIKAAQAGVIDVLTGHLNDEQRAAIPEHVITQLDGLLGFDGALQPSLAPGFSQRIDAVIAEYQQTEEAQEESGGPVNLPINPSLTERLASRGA